LTHRRAVALMVAAETIIWSIAGIVTRHLDSERGFDVTSWRSLFNALPLLLMLGWLQGPARIWHKLRSGGRWLWISALCWCVMYNAFMIAITLTTVAHVLVTMSIAPLLTALMARAALGHRLAARTWLASVVAGTGIAWMYAAELGGSDARQWIGTAVALLVPVAAAVNWTLLQHVHRRGGEEAPDRLAPVLLGAMLSAAAMLPLSQPFAASAHDLGLLGLLGVFQLAIPCLLAVRLARVLSAPEISLLSLLEVVFGVAWVWLASVEVPSMAVLGGGALVLRALASNEAVTLRRSAASIA
jgi:drug/metabolite transporter (DMT)-like permease